MRQNMRTMSEAMSLRFLVRHLANGRAHRVLAAQRTFAMHLGRQFEELQAQLMRHVVGFDVGRGIGATRLRVVP